MKRSLVNVLIGGVLSAFICGWSLAAMGQASTEVPAIELSAPNLVLPVKADDACKIDFNNIRVFGEDRSITAQLKRGKFERKYDSGYEAVSLDHVFCLRPGTGKSQQTVIVLNWLSCGGSCISTGIVQLIAIRAGHAVITQQFVFDSHATGTGAIFDKKSLTLKITGRSDDDSPNCCARNLDVVKYQWQGSRFVQKSYKRVPAPS